MYVGTGALGIQPTGYQPGIGWRNFPPGLQLPVQLRGITPLGQYQIIQLGDTGTCVNNLPTVNTAKWNGHEFNPREFIPCRIDN